MPQQTIQIRKQYVSIVSIVQAASTVPPVKSLPGLHTRLPGLQIDLPGARCTYSLGLNHRIANRILDPGGDFILVSKNILGAAIPRTPASRVMATDT